MITISTTYSRKCRFCHQSSPWFQWEWMAVGWGWWHSRRCTAPKRKGGSVARWEVNNEGYSTGGTYVRAGCHHSRTTSSACGGCYARATDALQEIADSGDASIAVEVLEAIVAEGEALRVKREGVGP